MKHSVKVLAVMLLLTVAAFLASCASSTIVEDLNINHNLPDIDPDVGLGYTYEAQMYFRLGNNPALVSAARSVQIRSNQQANKAILEDMFKGESGNSELKAVISANTEVEKIFTEGDIVYVTLNSDFLKTMALSEDENEIALSKRLAVYSIVNTILAQKKNLRVQIFIDKEGTDTRATLAELGFTDAEDPSQLIEPLGYSSDYIATPEKIISFAFDHLKSEEYDEAYVLFADSEASGKQKPDYAGFETEMNTLGHISEYKVYDENIAEDGLSATVKFDLKITAADGTSRTVSGKTARFVREGEIFKIGYQTLMELVTK